MPEHSDRTTAVVTGASGFVGSHLVERLVADGIHVRCLLRDSSSQRWLPQHELVEVHRVSYDSPEALDRAVRDVGAVYHLAAVTSAPGEQDYHRGNVRATAAVVESMQRAAPDAVLVYCSSQAAAGPSRDRRPLRETDEPHPITPYGRSKLEAERLVLASGVHATIVRPPTVYGPRDRDILEMFRWARRGLSPLVGKHEQQLSLVYVSDLVSALRAAAHASAGSVYFVTDGRIHTRSEVMAAVERAVRRRSLRLHIPVALAMGLAHVYRATSRVTGGKPLLTPDRIRDFCEPDWTCDDTLARTELRYESRISLEDGMQMTARWYMEHGWI